MLRPSLLPALVVAATLLAALCVGTVAGTVAPVQAAPPARAAEDTPLTVTIDTLSPTAIPRKGPVRVSGTVTNRDDAAWTDINLYAFVGDAPMTTAAELAAAAEVAPEDYVGARILLPDTYDTVAELAPGESVPYAFSVPRSAIDVEAEGVYWFGVHALGFNEDGGDSFADGRARTFMPLVDRTDRSVDTALVLPVRHRVNHRADGSIANVRRWTTALQQGGALAAPVDLGATAGSSRPVSWLVDPAVVDAVRRLAAGNPPRSLGATVTTGEGEDGEGDGEEGEEDGSSVSPSPSPSEQPGEDASGESDDEEDEPSPRLLAAAATASAWLARLEEAIEGKEVLALPYGDLDVAGAAAHAPGTYRDARKRSSGELEPWGVTTSPAVAPPSGFLDAAAIELIEPGATTLVTDRMFRGGGPPVAATGDRRLVVTSSGAASGGPGPDDPLTTVAVRQRIASEAAVRLLAPAQRPLVVAFPQTWRPEVDSGFFAGLDDLDWLNLTSVTTAEERVAATQVPLDRLRYPEEQEELELDAASFAAADSLVAAGETLQNLLTLNDQVATVVHDEAFAALSYESRTDPAGAVARVTGSRLWLEARLRSVRIDAPKAVILSSGSGRFAATVTNDLDQPVSVKIRAVVDPPLEVTVPEEAIELAPGSRTTVLLNASSSAVGIRNLTLLLTDTDDSPLGSSDDLPIRSNRVSNVIWLIMGTGVALLFGAIVVRLIRRVRTARRA